MEINTYKLNNTTIYIICIVSLAVGVILWLVSDKIEANERNWIISLLTSVYASTLSVLLVSITLYFLFPKVIKNSKITIIDFSSVSSKIEKEQKNSKEWKFKGACGRYTRSQTLPLLASNSKKYSSEYKIEMILLDPRCDKACEEYARYKNGVLSKDRNWSKQEVIEEIVSTIVSIAIYSKLYPLLNCNIYTIPYFSYFRYDSGNSAIIITSESKKSPAIYIPIMPISEEGNNCLENEYNMDYSLARNQAEQINNKDTHRFLETIQKKEDINEQLIKQIIDGTEILKNIPNIRYEKISENIKNPKNPYA